MKFSKTKIALVASLNLLLLSSVVDNKSANAAPSSFIDLGNIGLPDNYVFDTVGSETFEPSVSDTDTEMGIWDSTGTLLADNDDLAPGVFFSEISINLDPGEYFLGISQFNSVFADDFLNTGFAFGNGQEANLVLNINGLFAGSGIGSESLDQETLFFRVNVTSPSVPESSNMVGLGLLTVFGLGAGLKRKLTR